MELMLLFCYYKYYQSIYFFPFFKKKMVDGQKDSAARETAGVKAMQISGNIHGNTNR
jgi:hypothetical protein